MTEFAQQILGAAWEDAGRRVASSLDGTSSAIVVGDDPLVAAHAAIGIARAQAVGRRVAVADLVGDVPPLQDLVSGDDTHGITDSFQYGVSLSRIARQVDAGGTLFILPSGTEPDITPDVLRSERWRLLADSFEKAGALLLLVVPAQVEGLEELSRFVSGAVLVGDADPQELAHTRVLALVTPPRTAGYTPILSQAAPAVTEPATSAVHVEPAARRSRLPYLVGALIAAGIAGWFALPRPADRAAELPPAAAAGGAAASAPVAQPTPPTVPAAPNANAAVAAAARDTLPGGLTIVNPADSANAAAFTVLLSTFPTPAGARTRLEQDSPDVPAATVAPTREDGVERHQYVAGAYAGEAQADSLLGLLRRRAAVGTRGGAVVERPFAFLIRDGLPADSVRSITRRYLRRGVPAYALVQPDGTVRLYTGAYENPAQAALAAPAIRRAGVWPTLAYRTGRPR